MKRKIVLEEVDNGFLGQFVLVDPEMGKAVQVTKVFLKPEKAVAEVTQFLKDTEPEKK